MMSAPGTDYALGHWIVRPSRCIIQHGTESVHLKPKSIAVLQCLAGAQGRVVSRNDLFDSVWPGATISDDVLTQSIVDLRKAFGESARNAKIIETIPKMGFRLVPPVCPLETELDPAVPQLPGKGNVPLPQAKARQRQIPGVLALTVIIILLAGTIYWYQTGKLSGGRSPTIVVEDFPSIAVLPFVDMSTKGDQEYFADGLSEELLNRLSRLKGLKVTGRSSSFFFKGRNTGLKEIGETLGVGHVLEGSVRKAGNRLRIATQLVNTSNGYQLWSGVYDREMEDIFKIQDEISEAVAAALSIKLGVGDLGAIRGGTEDVEAYNEVLRGQSLYRQFNRDSLLLAIDHFKSATRLDPDYALAWERLADIYLTSRYIVGGDLSRDWPVLSGQALERAISLAPDAPDVLSATAFRQAHLMQWRDAQNSLNRLSALDVNLDVYTTAEFCTFLTRVGKVREAIELMERSRRLDPLSGIVAFYLGRQYMLDGRFEEAITELERGFQLGEYLSMVSANGVIAALATEDQDLIKMWLARAVEHHPAIRVMSTAMMGFLGDRDAALYWLHRNYQSDAAGRDYFAVWGAYYGDSAFALEVMRGGLESTWVFWAPVTAAVRKLPGFEDLVSNMGLVDYWREYGWGDYCRPAEGKEFICE